jgi:hypothetical protein
VVKGKTRPVDIFGVYRRDPPTEPKRRPFLQAVVSKAAGR